MHRTKARPAYVSSSTGNSRNSLFPPLSDHGMPKPPSPRSPEGSRLPHRHSGGLPSSPRPSEPPLTPMSPPMSAKSFGTFIDSAPSTPTYSPRTGSSWDSSTLVLLSPVPSSPQTPAEPSWEMMVPIQKAPSKRPSRFLRKSSLTPRHKIDEKETIVNTSFSSPPVQRPNHRPVQHVRSQSQKETYQPTEELIEEKKDEEEGQTPTAPLDRLATKMKSILRRKSDTDKKTEKKWKGYYELQRMETSHWTEL